MSHFKQIEPESRPRKRPDWRRAARAIQIMRLDPARTWRAERQNCLHDLLHVITGYSQATAGETALLAFTDGLLGPRFRLRVIRFGMLASVFTSPRGSILRCIHFAWRARQRGIQARIPFSYRWEEALERPLLEIRKEFGIVPVEVAHPNGLLRGSPDAPWTFQPE